MEKVIILDGIRYICVKMPSLGTDTYP